MTDINEDGWKRKRKDRGNAFLIYDTGRRVLPSLFYFASRLRKMRVAVPLAILAESPLQGSMVD